MRHKRFGQTILIDFVSLDTRNSHVLYFIMIYNYAKIVIVTHSSKTKSYSAMSKLVYIN